MREMVRPFRKPPATIPLLLVFTLTVVIGIQGFSHGSLNNFSNQSIQIPVIDSYADPYLFQNDILIEARDHYVTWFYPIIGFAARFIPLRELMLALYLVIVFATVVAIYLLGETLFPNKNTGVISVIMWMAYYPSLGGDIAHDPFVSHTSFAFALQLIALSLIFSEKSVWAALIIGIAANINPMSSFFVAFAWTFALFRDKTLWSWRLLRVPVLLSLPALPVLIWRFALALSPMQGHLEEYFEIMRARSWYHIFPFSMPPVLWIAFLLLIVIWLFAVRFGKPEKHSIVIGMTYGVILLCFLGTVFTEFVPMPLAIQLQPLRSTRILSLFAMFYIANMVDKLIANNRSKYLWLAYLLVVILAVPRWFVDIIPQTQPTPYLLYIDLDAPWPHNNPLNAFFLFLALLGLCWLTIQHYRSKLLKKNTRRFLMWSIFSIGCFALPVILYSPVPTEQRNITAAWADTLEWIRNNVPSDALFITPPTLDGFRTLAKRSHIGDWKDGTLGIFDGAVALEWWQRMLDMGFNPTDFSFSPLSRTQLCYLGNKYNADYAVIIQSWNIEVATLFENDMFMVASMNDIQCP